MNMTHAKKGAPVGAKRTRGSQAGRRPLALSLDRFEAALARRTAPYGRGELIEIMAEAFGHRNSHETTAAVEAGALTPTRLSPMGTATAPDGTRLVVGHDGEGRVLAFADAPARGERYVASPYGGIVDLADLAAGGPGTDLVPTFHVAEVTSGSRLMERVVALTRRDLVEKVAEVLVDGLLEERNVPDGDWDADAIIAAYRAQDRDDVTFYAPVATEREGGPAAAFVEGVPEEAHLMAVTYRNGGRGPGFVARTLGEVNARFAEWCVETYDLDPAMGVDAVLAWHAERRGDDVLTYATAEVDLAAAAVADRTGTAGGAVAGADVAPGATTSRPEGGDLLGRLACHGFDVVLTAGDDPVDGVAETLRFDVEPDDPSDDAFEGAGHATRVSSSAPASVRSALMEEVAAVSRAALARGGERADLARRLGPLSWLDDEALAGSVGAARGPGVGARPVPATCSSGDGTAVAEFDARRLVDEASDDEVVALARAGWRWSSEGDAAAPRGWGGEGAVAGPLAHAWRTGTGYACRVDEVAVVARLSETRPALVARMGLADVVVVDRGSLDDEAAVAFDEPWLVLFADGRVEGHPDEEAACARQRAWRAAIGLDPETGEAPGRG